MVRLDSHVRKPIVKSLLIVSLAATVILLPFVPSVLATPGQCTDPDSFGVVRHFHGRNLAVSNIHTGVKANVFTH